MVNRVILIGRLGQDPEVRRLESGATVAKFSVATNENYRDKSGDWQTLTEWHDVVVWRNLAERAESQLAKGALVYVDGKLTHRTWQDKDGNNRKTTEVVGNYFRRLDKREDGPGGSSSGYFPSAEDEQPSFNNTGNTAPANDPAPASTDAPADTSQDDDLPF
ncbi:MAG: single-stranded DNA-binding protein [Bacteroidetes bacterium]|nr:MAG: single-stranded DNA-binding protein [Bacteroidota bacterium]